jgi:hypothetical protein
MVGEGLVEIIDLEKDHPAVDFKRAKIVLFVRVVGATEIVVDRDGLDDPCDRSSPRAATPIVMTAVSTPVPRLWRSRSLRARICSVLVVVISLSRIE